MEIVLLLSASIVFREAPSLEKCLRLLTGVPVGALQKYAAEIGHSLARARELDFEPKELREYHEALIERSTCGDYWQCLKRRLGHRKRYRGVHWVLTDEHHLAKLVLSYAAANPNPAPGAGTPADYERLISAQLIVNDLVSGESEGGRSRSEVNQLVRLFAMHRRGSIMDAPARGFALFARLLPGRLTGLAEAVVSRFGIRIEELAVVFFGIYLGYMLQVIRGNASDCLPNPNWSEGRIALKGERIPPSAEKALDAAIAYLSTTWEELHVAASRLMPHNPSIAPFVKRPLIRTGPDEVWCFDPGLILIACSDGLLWSAKVAWEAAGHDGERVFRHLGRAFDDYVGEFLSNFALSKLDRDPTGETGFPDICFIEGRTLCAIELKSSTMREESQWSDEESDLTEELTEKITKDNQLMNAIQRYASAHPDLVESIDRVVPIIVTRDPLFASPGLERKVNQRVAKPSIGPEVHDVHLIQIPELEAAGLYIKNGHFARLLDVRRRIAGGGWIDVQDLIARRRAEIDKDLGVSFDTHDALKDARAAVNDAMRDFAANAEKSEEADGPPDSDTG